MRKAAPTRRKITRSELRALFTAQDGKCALCGEILEIWHIDHANPLALSGDDSTANLQLVCIPCHRVKTFGTKATSYGSDIHAIAKAKRLAGEGKARRAYVWPKRRMQSRPWPK